MVLEFDPEEVEEVLRVTAIALAFPSLPPEPWSPSKRRPITGVCERNTKRVSESVYVKGICPVLFCALLSFFYAFSYISILS